MLEVMRDISQSRYLRSNVAHKQLARTSLTATTNHGKGSVVWCGVGWGGVGWGGVGDDKKGNLGNKEKYY